MRVPFEVIKGFHSLQLSPMTSAEEKAILEFGVMTEDEDAVWLNVLNLLGIPTDWDYELQLAALYKVREISFGGDLKITWKCPHCGRVVESQLILENLLEYPQFEVLPDSLRDLPVNRMLQVPEILQLQPLGAWKAFTLGEPKSLKQANDMAIALRARLPKFRHSHSLRCMFCGHEKNADIRHRKFALDSMSEHTVTSLYKTYNALAREGFGKLDVDSMLPFEREIHMHLLEQRTTELREAMRKK